MNIKNRTRQHQQQQQHHQQHKEEEEEEVVEKLNCFGKPKKRSRIWLGS